MFVSRHTDASGSILDLPVRHKSSAIYAFGLTDFIFQSICNFRYFCLKTPFRWWTNFGSRHIPAVHPTTPRFRLTTESDVLCAATKLSRWKRRPVSYMQTVHARASHACTAPEDVQWPVLPTWCSGVSPIRNGSCTDRISDLTNVIRLRVAGHQEVNKYKKLTVRATFCGPTAYSIARGRITATRLLAENTNR